VFPQQEWVEEAKSRHKAWESQRIALIARYRQGSRFRIGGVRSQAVDPMNSERLDASIWVHTRMLSIRGDDVEVSFDRAIPGCPVEGILVDTGRSEIWILPKGAPEGPGFRVRRH